MEKDSRGYSPELWGKMAELGWTGLPFAEEHGGAGMSFLDLCILVEEQGRCRLPAPFFATVVLCALPIARFGSEAQQREHLTAIAGGGRVMTYAARSWLGARAIPARPRTLPQQLRSVWSECLRTDLELFCPTDTPRER